MTSRDQPVLDGCGRFSQSGSVRGGFRPRCRSSCGDHRRWTDVLLPSVDGVSDPLGVLDLVTHTRADRRGGRH
jgi:hypothetical protein